MEPVMQMLMKVSQWRKKKFDDKAPAEQSLWLLAPQSWKCAPDVKKLVNEA